MEYLTENEKRVLKYTAAANDWTDYTVKRKSLEEYDIGIKGEMLVESVMGNDPFTVGFSAALKLAFIRSVNWIRFANLSDYPEMVMFGDWSGIRDSSWEAQNEMFKAAYEEVFV